MIDPQEAEGAGPKVFTLAQIRHLMRVEFSRAQRYGYPIVCLVIAVDQLGELRDRVGYEGKEAVLADVIALVQASTRASDFLGRLPDDRLMLVVPHTEPAGVEVMARRLVEAGSSLEAPLLEGSSLSLSVGASWMTAGETLFFDDLMATAESCAQEAAAGGGGAYLGRVPGGLA